MSKDKDCGNHSLKRKRLYQRLFGAFLALIFIALLITLIVWLVLRPTKPRFILQDATVYSFNVSAPNMLTSIFQVTISSRNPNDRIGITYTKLDVFASYRNQQITLPTVLPPTYQGHNDITIWSPYLSGNSVPVAPYLAAALSQDQQQGLIMVHIKIDGRVKWKVGSWMSGRYHLYVNCPAYISFGSKSSGVPVGANAVKFQLQSGCDVDV